MKNQYRVIHGGYVAGRKRSKGDIVSLTAAQARYEYVELITDNTDDGTVAESSTPKPKARKKN